LKTNTEILSLEATNDKCRFIRKKRLKVIVTYEVTVTYRPLEAAYK